MGFFWKNKFWIGIVLAVAGIIVCYCIFVIPTQQLIYRNTKKLEKTKTDLDGMKRKGVDIATAAKIRKCKKTQETLEEEHAEVVKFFLEQSVEIWGFWPEVVDGRGVPNGALFKEKYNEETLLLEKELAKDMDLSEGVFPWVKFGAEVPLPKRCYPIMRDFWVVKDIAELLRGTGSVELLSDLRLGEREDQVLEVGGIGFYVRSLTIRAHVHYPKLLFLLAKLQESPRNIYIDTISIEESQISRGKDKEEPPVVVVLNCSMLRAQGPPKDKGG